MKYEKRAPLWKKKKIEKAYTKNLVIKLIMPYKLQLEAAPERNLFYLQPIWLANTFHWMEFNLKESCCFLLRK